MTRNGCIFSKLIKTRFRLISVFFLFGFICCLFVCFFIRSSSNKAHLLKVESAEVAVYCHMTNLGACGGGGWTLVMKMNGTQVLKCFFRRLITQ